MSGGFSSIYWARLFLDLKIVGHIIRWANSCDQAFFSLIGVGIFSILLLGEGSAVVAGSFITTTVVLECNASPSDTHDHPCGDGLHASGGPIPEGP